MVGVMENIVFPSTIVLERAYPNPFNPVTNITFGIENDALVSVKGFDVAGREIADLANGVYSAGYHIVDWNANAHSSGLYFLTQRRYATDLFPDPPLRSCESSTSKKDEKRNPDDKRKRKPEKKLGSTNWVRPSRLYYPAFSV